MSVEHTTEKSGARAMAHRNYKTVLNQSGCSTKEKETSNRTQMCKNYCHTRIKFAYWNLRCKYICEQCTMLLYNLYTMRVNAIKVHHRYSCYLPQLLATAQFKEIHNSFRLHLLLQKMTQFPQIVGFHVAHTSKSPEFPIPRTEGTYISLLNVRS